MATDIDRLKRQLLRDLVQENVDLIEGRLPRRVKPRPRILLRVLVLVLLSLGLLTLGLLTLLTLLALTLAILLALRLLAGLRLLISARLRALRILFTRSLTRLSLLRLLIALLRLDSAPQRIQAVCQLPCAVQGFFEALAFAAFARAAFSRS